MVVLFFANFFGRVPGDDTSFTYPDSFTAMGFGTRFGLPHETRPYHGRVFQLHELGEAIATYGFPSDDADEDYDGYQHRPFEKYIEVQLWSDEPIRSYLASADESS